MPRRLTRLPACRLAASPKLQQAREAPAKSWRGCSGDEAKQYAARQARFTNSSRSTGSRLAGDGGCEAQSGRLRAATGTVALLPGGRELSLSLRLSISRK